MPPTERSTFSIQELAIRILLPMLIGGAIVYAVMQLMTTRGSDRPPIIVSDGSIEIEESASADDTTTTPGKGKLEKLAAPVDGRNVWRHAHPGGAPTRLNVLVEGADTSLSTNCPAMYFAQNFTAATISYAVDGGSRTVIVSKEPGNKPLDISVDLNAGATQTYDHTLTLDKELNAKLASVDIVWTTGNTSTTVTCRFGGSAAPRLVFLQTK
jgi:hypothetical protein